MKNEQLNLTATRLICAGLLLYFLAFLLQNSTKINDFWKGFPVGIGLSFIIVGFIRKNKNQKS